MVHWLMIVLFIGWGTFFTFVLIRFRKSKSPAANYHGVKNHFSNYLEVCVLIAEVILLVVFSIPLWSKRVDAFPSTSEATVIRVVAEQFAWNIHYPGPDGKFGKTSITLIDQDNPLGLDRSDPDAKDDIVMNNNMNLPVNKPVIIYLSTKDVIHSLNLPVYRVKQDAIPGMSTPVWFTPVKTTDQIREELRHQYSISEAMKKVRKVSLPAMSKMAVKAGSDMDEYMLMDDVKDNSGTMVLGKGERLDTSNTRKLAGAGRNEVSARPVANLDKFISMEEVKDNSGTILVGKNEALSEEAVTRLVGAGMKDVPARQVSNMDVFVLMESYSDKSGAALNAKGDAVSEELITKLAEAGINEVTIAPATPTEIACAQLCGLGHFRMRGYMTVQTPEEYQKWYDQQEAALQPQSAPPDSTQHAAPDSTAVSTNQEVHH